MRLNLLESMFEPIFHSVKKKSWKFIELSIHNRIFKDILGCVDRLSSYPTEGICTYLLLDNSRRVFYIIGYTIKHWFRHNVKLAVLSFSLIGIISLSLLFVKTSNAVTINGKQLFPPQIAQQVIGTPTQSGGTHSFGAIPPKISLNVVKPKAADVATALQVLPASVDLSQYAAPVGEQGNVSSCMAWAEDYYQRGWYAKRDGYYPGGGAGGTGSFAPMYTYSQVPGGSTNSGTYMNDHYNVMISQGVDSRADYTQGDYNYIDQPNASERANAASYKIASYSNPWSAGLPGGPGVQLAIENSLAAGNPVVIIFDVYYDYYGASPADYYVEMPPPGSLPFGTHGNVVLKYDQNGIWVENEWGTGWGLNGWAELSWDYVNNYVYQVGEITPIAPSPSLTPTPTPTPTPSPTPSPLIVTITNPLNGSTVRRRSNLTIKANVVDSITIKNVKFYVNGTLECTDRGYPYSCVWNVGSTGTYIIKVTALDNAGKSASSSVTVTAK